MYPERLISDNDKCKKTVDLLCEGCYLVRRTTVESIFTIGGEIDPEILQLEDIFDMSMNVELCQIHRHNLPLEREDVRYSVSVKDDKKFVIDGVNEEADPDINFFHSTQGAIALFEKKDLSSIIGTYPLNKGTNKEEEYAFVLQVVYDPTIYNFSHAELRVYAKKEGDNNSKLEHKTNYKNKTWKKEIATQVKNAIIEGKLVLKV